MRYLITLTANVGQFFASLSDKTRLRLVLVGLLLLGGPAIYKLVISLQNLTKPLPSASTDAFIRPMEQLVKQTSTNMRTYRYASSRQRYLLDSLRALNSDSTTTSR